MVAILGRCNEFEAVLLNASTAVGRCDVGAWDYIRCDLGAETFCFGAGVCADKA